MGSNKESSYDFDRPQLPRKLGKDRQNTHPSFGHFTEKEYICKQIAELTKSKDYENDKDRVD